MEKYGRRSKPQQAPALDGSKCEDHFKNLFAKVDENIDAILEKTEQPINEFLNREFTLDELKDVIKFLA